VKGSQDSSALNRADDRPCERWRLMEASAVWFFLSRSKILALTCVRALPGVMQATEALDRLHTMTGPPDRGRSG
jgi:hypothetical protein